MTRTDKGLAAAVGLSIVLHVAALFGTSPIAFDWSYTAPALIEVTIEATIVPPAPVAIAPQPVARPVKRARSRPVPSAPRVAEPMPVASTGLLPAPTPDGEPIAEPPAVAEAAPAEIDTAGVTGTADAGVVKPAAEYPLKRARLVYDLYFATVSSGNAATLVGHLTHTWSQDGRRYEAEAVAEASGLVALFFGGKFVQRSTGQLGADGLVPEKYTLDRGSGNRPEVARFDWAGGKLALEWKSEARTLDLPPGAQDPLSILHQLYFMQPLPEAGSLSVVTSRKLGRYVFQLAGEETVATPLGSLRALHFRRHDSDGTAIEVWADLDRNLLPARIYAVDRKGNVLDQVIREVQLEPIATAAAVTRP